MGGIGGLEVVGKGWKLVVFMGCLTNIQPGDFLLIPIRKVSRDSSTMVKRSMECMGTFKVNSKPEIIGLPHHHDCA